MKKWKIAGCLAIFLSIVKVDSYCEWNLSLFFLVCSLLKSKLRGAQCIKGLLCLDDNPLPRPRCSTISMH